MISPLATYRYCPFCGTPYAQTSPEATELYCAQCSQHIFANLPTTASAVIFSPDGQEVLFTRRAHAPQIGFLDIPGGFCDPWEHPEEALQRELQEEMGVSVETNGIFGIYAPVTYQFEGRTQYNCDIFYRATLPTTTALQPGDDVASAQWFSLHQLPLPEEMAFISGQKVIQELRAIYTQEEA